MNIVEAKNFYTLEELCGEAVNPIQQMIDLRDAMLMPLGPGYAIYTHKVIDLTTGESCWIVRCEDGQSEE